jgi:hypothetical protein
MSIENINWGKTGGPAFPATFDNSSNDIYIHGMSLRDWFAGMFVTKAYTERVDIDRSIEECVWYEFDPIATANKAYQLADAMLALRSKAKGEQQ